MPDVIGLITANYSIKHPNVLVESRPAASMPFGARYRLIDFPLSNMVNCGIRTVGVIMPYNYRSIIDHIESGRDWLLDRKKGGLFVLPGSAFGTSRTGSRFLLRDFKYNSIYLERSNAEYVLCSASNFVYNADLSELIENHKRTGADITVLIHKTGIADDDVIALDVEEGRVRGIRQGVAYGDTAFLDCFIIGRKLLLELLEWYAAVDYLDLFEAMKEDFSRLNVLTLEHTGYVASVFNTQSYFKHNMEILDPKVSKELFPVHRSIKTKTHDNPPTMYNIGCRVHNSALAGGCKISGTVYQSIVGRDVVIEPGAIVRNSIIGQGCVIERGSHIENAIIDRNNTIVAGTELRGTPEAIIVKEKGSNR